MKDAITLLLSLFVGICFGTILTRSYSLKQMGIPQTDTITIVKIEPIIHYKPVPVKTTALGEYSFDKYTPYAFFTDTIETVKYEQGNTFYHEIKEYKDSTYYARISGINANLEEIQVFPTMVTKYVTVAKEVQQKPKKWGLGVSAGMAVAGGKVQPYIGAGITYDIIQW